ncbi:hypothetical protein F1C58_09995 [Glaciihabitans sp. INWT7]|uniref:hypothetical protein n=1 Tax=Glaciihabitans sp. INWT7 TaxID=2596912 RepID=UPI0016275E23|nr:hypothetical protein [Glaciihabitans sp. INWT7]QNE47194.1 hypothetical protein F1C58_09995 [Glaciihabitans sp. INWT7]
MSGRPAGSPRQRGQLLLGVVLPLIAGVLAITGLILLLRPDPPASFGWFAFVPLSSTTFVPTPWFSSTLHAAGAILIGVGIAALVFCLGWRVGRR